MGKKELIIVPVNINVQKLKTEEYRKQIQKIVEDLKIDIDELLKDFDNEETLTKDDADIIKKEYDDVLQIAYDSIDNILEKYPTDLNYQNIIERKITLIDDMVNQFLFVNYIS